MANGSGGVVGGFEALQNVPQNVFPPIYYVPTGPGGGAANGTHSANYTEAIEREYVEDYVFQSAFSVVYLLIFTLGVFGNVLVVYVVWANKHMRTVTNIFIVNLAVSDIMLCGLAVPFTPLYTFTGKCRSSSFRYANSSVASRFGYGRPCHRGRYRFGPHWYRNLQRSYASRVGVRHVSKGT